MTVQDTVSLEEFRQTITGLAYQVDQLTGVVQDTAKAASDKSGDGTDGGVLSLRAENQTLRQSQGQMPDLALVRERIISGGPMDLLK